MIRHIVTAMTALFILGACAPTVAGEPISKEEYDQLKPGMSYEAVVKTIGGEPHDPAVGKRPVASTLAILHAPAEFGGTVNIIMMDGKLKEAMHTPPTDGPLVAPTFFGSIITLLFAVFSTFYYFYKKYWPDAEGRQPKMWKRIAILSWVVGIASFVIMVNVA